MTQILPADPGRSASGRIRDDLGRVTQDLAHRFEDLIRVAPTHWHLLQPNWPSDRGRRPCRSAAPGWDDHERGRDARA